MKKIVALGAILMIAAACSRQTANNSQDSAVNSNNPAPAASSAAGPTVDKYPTLVSLGGEFPGKYKCGASSLTGVGDEVQDLKLEPANKILLHLDPKNTARSHYDATFSKDCSKVYYAVASDDPVQIRVWDIATGKQTLITIPHSAFPGETVLKFDKDYYPALNVIYPIDNNQLLLSFETQSTGKDAYTNQSAQAIYNLATKKINFISVNGEDITGPNGNITTSFYLPILLNYKTNTLIGGNASNDNGALISQRVEIDLTTGNRKSVALKSPYQYTLPLCDSTAPDFTDCRNKWLDPLFNDNPNPYQTFTSNNISFQYPNTGILTQTLNATTQKTWNIQELNAGFTVNIDYRASGFNSGLAACDPPDQIIKTFTIAGKNVLLCFGRTLAGNVADYEANIDLGNGAYVNFLVQPEEKVKQSAEKYLEQILATIKISN